MFTTIRKLCCGDLEPAWERGRDRKEMKEVEGLMRRNLDKLDASLGEEEKKLLTKYFDSESEYSLLQTEQAFYEGFSLGVRLVAEAMVGET